MFIISWNVIQANLQTIMIDNFVKIIWAVSPYDTVARICCKNISDRPSVCYDKKSNFMENISTASYGRGWLPLPEAGNCLGVGLQPGTVIGASAGFNGQIMSSGRGHGFVY